MADIVEQVMQDMVPELDDLRAKKIFDEAELRQIIKRRRDFEYLLLRSQSKPQDFLGYVRYEIALEVLRGRRSKALHWRKKSLSDFAGVRRVHSIFGRGVQKFRGDLRFWYQYVDFCLRCGSTKMLSRILLQAVKIHPREANFWLLAADRELKYGHIKAARALLQRGIRFLPRSSKLWCEFLRLEVQVARNMADLERIKEADKGAALASAASSASSVSPEENQSQTANLWSPASVLLRGALTKLDASPGSCAELLTVAVRCIEKASESCSQDGLKSFTEQVRSAVAERRPGVYVSTGEAWADVPAEVAIKLWELWWHQERSHGRGWRGIARVVAEKAPTAVVQRCAKALTTARGDGKGGAPLKALVELAEMVAEKLEQGESSVAEGEMALFVLGALEQCREANGLAAAAYDSLLQRAAKAQPSCLRLRLLALQKSGEVVPDAATLLDCVHDLQPTDAAQYLAIVTALVSAKGDSRSILASKDVDLQATFEILLRSLAPGTSVQPLAKLLLTEALSRSVADFRAACDHVIAMTLHFWQVPRIRMELYEVVLEAELRVVAPPEMPPQQTCKRFEELLSLLDNDEPLKVQWWIRYIEFAHRAHKWSCGTDVPSTANLQWRASRSVVDQAGFMERYQELLQFLT